MKPETISLRDELSQLIAVLETVVLLLEQLSNEEFHDAESTARAPRLIGSVVQLVLGRVTLLRKVVLQHVEVSLIAGSNNRRDRIDAHEDPDVLLPVKAKRR